MYIMTKEEAKSTICNWPANTKQAIDCDARMVKTAAWRHKVLMNKYKKMFETKGKGT